MSRSKKGQKGPGYEYWSRRPGSSKSGCSPGRVAKARTHALERIEGKEEVRDQVEATIVPPAQCPQCQSDKVSTTKTRSIYCEECGRVTLKSGRCRKALDLGMDVCEDDKPLRDILEEEYQGSRHEDED